MTIDTPELTLMLVRSSQTSAGLKTRGADAFDVTPGARLVERSQNGFCHLGDLDLRLRASSSGEWRSHSTAAARAPVAALPAATPFTPAARLRVEQPAKIAGVGTCAPAAALASEREAFVIPLTEAMSCVELRAK